MAFQSIKSLNSLWRNMHAAIRTPWPLTHAGAPLIRRSLQNLSRYYNYPSYRSGLSNAKIIVVSFESVTIASLPRTWDVGRIEIKDQFSLLRNCPPTHHFALSVACVAWRFCRAGRRSGVATKNSRAKRARTSGEAARKIKTACPDSWPFQLPPPSTHFDILLTTCLVSVFPANQK